MSYQPSASRLRREAAAQQAARRQRPRRRRRVDFGRGVATAFANGTYPL